MDKLDACSFGRLVDHVRSCSDDAWARTWSKSHRLHVIMAGMAILGMVLRLAALRNAGKAEDAAWKGGGGAAVGARGMRRQ